MLIVGKRTQSCTGDGWNVSIGHSSTVHRFELIYFRSVIVIVQIGNELLHLEP